MSTSKVQNICSKTGRKRTKKLKLIFETEYAETQQNRFFFFKRSKIVCLFIFSIQYFLQIPLHFCAFSLCCWCVFFRRSFHSRVVYCFGHTFTSDCLKRYWFTASRVCKMKRTQEREKNTRIMSSFVEFCCYGKACCRRILGDDIYYEKTSYGSV